MRTLNTRLLTQFTLVFVTLSFVPTLYFINEVLKLDKVAENHVSQAQTAKLEFSRLELVSVVDKVTKSVRILAENGMLNRALESPTQINYEAVEDFWLLVARSQGVFSQLRLLGADGTELIRVNHQKNSTEVVARSHLQDKSHRDYFAYAKTLESGQLGMFGIDLEYENDKLVEPHQPSLRLIIPLDRSGTRKGYFVANINFESIYQMLAFQDTNVDLPEVVNASGYYVMSSAGNHILGHIATENAEYNVAVQSPKLWRQILLHRNGTVYDNRTWYSFTKAKVKTSAQPIEFILINSVPDSQIKHVVQANNTQLFSLALLVYIATFAISSLFVIWNYNHKKNSMESRIARAAMNGMSAMIITDRHNRIIKINEEFTRISGYTIDQVKGKQPSLFASGKHDQGFYDNMWKILESDGLWEGEVINRRRDGSLITEILRIQTVTDKQGVVQFYVASFVDISHRKELENRLRELSEVDSLSGLSNRRKFDLEMQSVCNRIKRYPDKELACLAIMDIDHFKRINDKYGHDVGDREIRSVAKTLKYHLRETDFLARIGGEEFAVIMPHTSLKEAELVTNRLRSAVQINDDTMVTISVGLTDVCVSMSQSYKRADVALYDSKSSGRNKVTIVSETESSTIA
ncbi:diguanylate cyclase [Vibrio sonorensis]|uniref:diguanylate cyclase n=1 Tax=Vibrio sonorensis TaxID=1004316 RepID=UPI0008DA6EBB|nr:diguanylate cyclase [Vibrio sonorensis]